VSAPDGINDLEKLLPEEREELRTLFLGWKEARDRKDWGTADKLRARFWWWDQQLGSDGLWHPAFEYSLNRQRRAFKRMQRYGVDVYPWTVDMV
jgi:hypothetical protein